MELHSLLWSHLHNSPSGMSRYGRPILTLSLRHTRGKRAFLGSEQFIGKHVDTTGQPGDKKIYGGITVLAVETEVSLHTGVGNCSTGSKVAAHASEITT